MLLRARWSSLRSTIWTGSISTGEYPGQEGSGNRFLPEGQAKLHPFFHSGRFVRGSSEKREKIRRPLYLTIATGASSAFLANTEMNKVQRYVDTINLMAYDYYEPGGDGITGNHAPLFAESR